MRTQLFITAATALALTGVAACAPGGRATARTSLDCPATQGELTRTAVAADHKTCTYLTSNGAEVSLQLIPVAGNAEATLATLEASLAAPTPESLAEAAKAEAEEAKATTEPKAVSGAAKAADETAKDANAVAKDAEQAAAEAAADARADQVDVDIPGVHVQAHGRNADGSPETARVNLPGIHITADEDDAQVRIGGMSINANGGEATVKVMRDTRLKGEAFSREKRGLRATYIYSGRNLPNGYRFVGYEAAGPKVGPLAVAIVRSKSASRHGEDAYPDVKKLVRRNGGV
jgi:hypothetical protein